MAAVAMDKSGSLRRYICQACRHQVKTTPRQFSTSTRRRAEERSNKIEDWVSQLTPTRREQNRPGRPGTGSTSRGGTQFMDIYDRARSAHGEDVDGKKEGAKEVPMGEALHHKLYIYSRRHNCHIQLLQPKKPAMYTISSNISSTSTDRGDREKMVDTLISVSSGCIGFKGAARGSYDASFQLASYVIKQISEKGLLPDIQKLEVILRGFGAGREASTKALLGTEGRYLRDRIVMVRDNTKLKIGGQRSQKPKRR